MKKCRTLTPGELEELASLLFDEELKHYIDAHPDDSPEQICAHFGIPLDPMVWNQTLDVLPDALRRLQESPNPLDRKNWRHRDS